MVKFIATLRVRTYYLVVLTRFQRSTTAEKKELRKVLVHGLNETVTPINLKRMILTFPKFVCNYSSP